MTNSLPLPRAVIFDLGKVLVDFDYAHAAKRIFAHCDRPPAIAALPGFVPLLDKLERGAITARQFFDTVQAATGFRDSYGTFRELFGDIFTEIPAMVALHGALRARGVPTWIFSNTNDIAVELIRRRFPFFGTFTGYVLSYEHGAMKPEPALYEVVERLTGRRGGELLYLDDRGENVEAGRARGWQVILHETSAASGAAVRASGLLN